MKKKYVLILFLICNMVLWSQENKLSGKITDKDGEPLPGVTILIDGTTTGTGTDFDGNYSIIAERGAVLVFSYMGMLTQKITVSNNNVINVVMKEDANLLDEVVVVGYGTQKRKDITGAVTSIKSAVFEKGAPASLQAALAGRVAGVQVTQTDNSPGAGLKILIRGGSSLTAGNQPLFVIDGFPVLPDDDPLNNPLADISSDNIESIEILKDASATAIYGAQGSNGVIIITTKMGKSGKPQISVKVSYGLSEVANAPDILTPEEYLDFIIDRNMVESYNRGNKYTEYWNNIKDSNVKGRNWLDDITRTAQTVDANIGFTGSGDGLRYGVFAGVNSQEGVVKKSEFNKFNFSTNLEQKIGKKIKIGTSFKIATSKNEGLLNSWQQLNIIKMALHNNPFSQDDLPFTEGDPDDPTYNWNSDNIFEFINSPQNEFETARMLGNMFVNYNIAKGLDFYTSYGFNRQHRDQHSFFPSTLRMAETAGGIANISKSKFHNFVYQARLNYRKNIKKNSINFTGVYETRKSESTYFSVRVQEFSEQQLGVYDLSSAVTPNLPINRYNEYSMISYLARLNYNYAGKYFLTASFRADGSSKFGKDNKYGYFPSLGVSWILSQENFIKNLNTFDLLKLRMSYGITGNDQIGSYRSLSQLGTSKYVINESIISGVTPGSVANPNLKWETTDQYNIGLDLAFFDNKLTFTADAYYKETTDLLLDVQLPLTSGFQTATENIGSISNKGLEFGLNSVNIDKNDFKWTTNFTWSTNRSKVLDLGERQEMIFTRYMAYQADPNVIAVRVGDPIGLFYGYMEDGVINSQTELDNSPVNNLFTNTIGQVKIVDTNGDGQISTADRVPIAKTAPDFTGGLNNQLSYKNFDFSIFMRYTVGNDIVNANTEFLELAGQNNYNTFSGIPGNVFSPLNPTGDFHGYKVPAGYRSVLKSNNVEDGSFLKIDYITLGYTLEKELLNKINIKRLRVYGRVSNPFMFTRYSWFDPEVSTGWGTPGRVGPGVDLGTYPRSTTLTFGVEIVL